MKKIPLDFLARAQREVKKTFLARVNGTTTVSCSGTYTAFLDSNDHVVVAKDNLHDLVDAPFCIEFDVRYNNGEVIFNAQRIFSE